MCFGGVSLENTEGRALFVWILKISAKLKSLTIRQGESMYKLVYVHTNMHV